MSLILILFIYIYYGTFFALSRLVLLRLELGMIEKMFNKGTMPALEAMLKFRSKRHEVLLNNVANVETPGYRSQDLDLKSFQSMLSKMMTRQKENAGQPRGAGTGSDFSALSGSYAAKPRDVFNGELPLDGHTPVMETEMAKLMKNGLHMQVLTQLVNGAYNGLEGAWRGRLR